LIRVKMLTAALLASLLTLMSQTTLAYYSTVGTATNVVTSGSIRFIIHETTDQGRPFPQAGIVIIPGDVVSKKVCMENDCAHPFYLRAKVISGINSEELSSEKCFQLDMNDEHWVRHDGWYYYTKIVDPGDTTEELFSRVKIVGPEVDNRYLGKMLTLTVTAQAVQSENNPIDKNAPFTAAGWPQG